MRALSNYSWPGNIRELSNLVERLAILHPSGTVTLTDLPKKYREIPLSRGGRGHLPGTRAEFDNLNLKGHLQQIETDLISKAMQKTGGVVAKAARLLNLRRTTLVEKMRKFDLSRDDQVSGL